MNRDSWETPDYIMHHVKSIYGVNMDVACTKENAKLDNFIDEDSNALSHSAKWDGNVYCNPPYSNILPWLEKGKDQLMKNYNCKKVVFLLPCDFRPKWSYYCAKHASFIYILCGTVNFIAPVGIKSSSNTRANMLVVFEKYRPPAFIFTDRNEKGYRPSIAIISVDAMKENYRNLDKYGCSSISGEA